MIPADAHERFEQRLRETDWAAATASDVAFSLSPADLTRFAPVVDEFKKLDRNIVATSIGNKWREVRTVFRDRAVPDSIAIDWRRGRRPTSVRRPGMSFQATSGGLSGMPLSSLPTVVIDTETTGPRRRESPDRRNRRGPAGFPVRRARSAFIPSWSIPASRSRGLLPKFTVSPIPMSTAHLPSRNEWLSSRPGPGRRL